MTGLGWSIGHVNRRVSVAVVPITSACSVSNAPWDTTRTRRAPVRVVSFVSCVIICIMIRMLRSLQNDHEIVTCFPQHAIVHDKALFMGHVTPRQVSACVILAWRDRGATAVLNLTRPFLIALVITQLHVCSSIVSSHARLVATCITCRAFGTF